MRILEGTPDEIFKYQEQQLSTNKNPFVAKQPYVTDERRGSMAQAIKRSFLLQESHWSDTKHEWVHIKDMDSVYIANVLRKMLRENKSADLLEDREFLSLTLNLANKIIENQ